MRSFRIYILIAAIGFGSLYFFNNNDFLKGYIENGEITTLEAGFTPDQIIKGASLPDKNYSFKEPTLLFYPYLLLDVKYVGPNKGTREGVILWSLVDGEMVIDTQNWKKTHGFEDAINAKATASDMNLLKLLSETKNGTLSKARLIKGLSIKPQALDRILFNAKNKHLITEKNNEISLHFQNPYFNVIPETKLHHALVTKPFAHAQKVSKKYSHSQIERIAKATFGDDFAIRSTKEVYLPVYHIGINNPDGSVASTHWNALSGKLL